MFLISGPELVVAVSKDGIIGAFPTPNARPIAVQAVELIAVLVDRIEAEFNTARSRLAAWSGRAVV